MSTVKADNFTWKTGQATGQSGTNVTGDQIVYGVAKSWVNFTTVTTTSSRGSFNVASLTDNGTGNTTVAFSNSFADTNYCPVVTAYDTITNGISSNIPSLSSSTIIIQNGRYSSGATDLTYVTLAVFR